MNGQRESKSLIIHKVWSHDSPPSGRHLVSKLLGRDADSSRDDAHAKLLLLTSDSITVLDAQAEEAERKSMVEMYSLPLQRIQDVHMEGPEGDMIAIEYIASTFSDGATQVKKSKDFITVVGALSPVRLSERFGEDSTQVSITRLHAVSSIKTQEIVNNIRDGIQNLRSALDWLDCGFPIPPVAPKLLSIQSGSTWGDSSQLVIADMPQTEQKFTWSIPKNSSNDCSMVFTVSSPVGICRGQVMGSELFRLCPDVAPAEEKQLALKAKPLTDIQFAASSPEYYIEIRCSVERVADSQEKQDVGWNKNGPIVAALASVLSAVFVSGGVQLFMLSTLILIGWYWKNSKNSSGVNQVCNFKFTYKSAVMEVEQTPGLQPLSPPKEVKSRSEIESIGESIRHQDKLLNVGNISLRRSIMISRVDGNVEYDLHESITMSPSDITADEQRQLKELHGLSRAVNIDLFRRYIEACKGDRVFAMQRLRKTAEWRAAHQIDTILERPIPYFHLLKKNYVHTVIGRSIDGLPVVVEGMGGFRQTMVALRNSGIVPNKPEEVIHQFVFVVEWITRVLEPTQFPRGQFIRIYDFKGIHLGDIADHEAVNLGKQMMDVLENHYPERMAKAFVINVPRFFSAIWSVIKPLLDPHTAKKITVISKHSKVLPTLQEHISLDVIPKAFGGQGIDDWYDSVEEKDFFELANKNNTGNVVVNS
jgi:hypothetical protein